MKVKQFQKKYQEYLYIFERNTDVIILHCPLCHNNTGFMFKNLNNPNNQFESESFWACECKIDPIEDDCVEVK
ncbi:hypothetical protein ELUMI_v1c05250 [Williamsoniiplasma luminosum]|uniref:Phage protein n=1 Tax=Williamsoniiplasma luminosum TaxID=214888 RepID=A0A2K8NTX9_9MOLU|nr:hypothetical protein [Williamsoniiplasma luminosum]ATZ17249.1 hypothetical protein ELUMI_v1c05250 [Williamsoniiplasma luminosum]